MSEMLIRRYEPNGNEEMGLYLNYLPLQTGLYRFHKEIADTNGTQYERPAAWLYTLQGGDAGCGTWAISEADSATNLITIDTATESQLAGTFSVTFFKVTNCPARVYPDTLKFTGGRYHLEF